MFYLATLYWFCVEYIIGGNSKIKNSSRTRMIIPCEKWQQKGCWLGGFGKKRLQGYFVSRADGVRQ